jgi:hypothetical protein
MTKYGMRWIALVGAAGAVAGGLWWWRATEDLVPVVAVLGVASMAGVGALWQARVRAVRRWRRALDAYADRALAQNPHRKPRKRSATRVG